LVSARRGNRPQATDNYELVCEGFMKSAGNAGEEVLVVSQCCQENYAGSCRQGHAFWHRYRLWEGGVQGTVGAEPLGRVEMDFGWETEGCADGFAVISVAGKETEMLLASCPGGLCLVDPSAVGEVGGETLVFRLRMPEGSKLSNVAIGEDGYVYLTGTGSLWRMRLSDSAFEAIGAGQRGLSTSSPADPTTATPGSSGQETAATEAPDSTSDVGGDGNNKRKGVTFAEKKVSEEAEIVTVGGGKGVHTVVKTDDFVGTTVQTTGQDRHETNAGVKSIESRPESSEIAAVEAFDSPADEGARIPGGSSVEKTASGGLGLDSAAEPVADSPEDG
jgi:hypothetical protein